MSRYLPEIIDYLNHISPVEPKVAIILGSGLSDTVNQIENGIHIPYDSIPHYPLSTVQGHAGEFIIGILQGVPVIVARGRFHYYEGYDFETITLPIRVFNKMGAGMVVITNAAGSARKDFPPGSLMAITGHLDGTFRHSEKSPEVVSGRPYYSDELISFLEKSAKENNIELKKGNYCWTQGPTFETSEEVQYFKECGADAVGMSTVPEIIMAGELEMDVIGISCITNFGAGISKEPLTHEEVMETTQLVQEDFNRLITTFVMHYYQEKR